MVPCLARASASASASDPFPSHSTTDNHDRRVLRFLDRAKTPSQLKQSHAYLLRRGHNHPFLIAKLVRLYSSPRHGRPDLATALLLSSNLPPPTLTLSWNLLIRSYASNGQPLQALLLYNRMLSLRIPIDKFTFPFVIAACSRLPHLSKAMEIHAFAIKTGFYADHFLLNTLIHAYFSSGDAALGRKVFDEMPVKRTIVSWTALVSGLAACGELDEARDAFEAAPARNVVTWTAMIDGYARNNRPEKAFELFHKMVAEGIRPNAFTVVALLIACTELGSLRLGRWVHKYVRRQRRSNTTGILLVTNVYVGTALIGMYSKCGSLEDAVDVFAAMPVKSLATWNSMITSMGVHGRGREAVGLFRDMERWNVRPDGITFVGVLCACVRAGMVDDGCRIFGDMVGRYGVVPGDEHYDCMVELLGSVEVLDGAREMMVESLILELDLGGRNKLLRACRVRGNALLEELVRRCILTKRSPCLQPAAIAI